MGLHENMRNEPVSQLALREPVTTVPTDSMREAIQQMREKKLGCAVVVDDESKPIGMLTESMITHMIAQKAAILDDPVQQHMAEQLPWVKLTDPIGDVLEAMQLKNLRFLCVIDDEGKLAGLTGQKGLMEYVADHFPKQVMVQRIGSKPYMTEREGA